MAHLFYLKSFLFSQLKIFCIERKIISEKLKRLNCSDTNVRLTCQRVDVDRERSELLNS